MTSSPLPPAAIRQPPGASAAPAPQLPRRAPRSLAEALRCGPFHIALRYAIADSGLNLEALRRRLAAEGHPVSLSALSYWQRGLRRPERPESMRAVLAMERILGLKRSSLLVLLGPPRPRGRGPDPTASRLGFQEALGPKPSLSAVLDGLDVTVNSRIQHLSQQNDRTVSAQRAWVSDRVRRVVLAEQDGVDRFVCLNVPDIPGDPPPELRPVSGCRLGRVREEPASGLRAAELLFDLPLRLGQAHVFEYDLLAHARTGSTTRWLIGTRHGLRELILRAHFPPGTLPVRCYHVRRDRHDTPWQDVGELPLSATGTVNLVSLNVAPGIEGIRWEWK